MYDVYFFLHFQLACCGGQSFTDYHQSIWAQDYDSNIEVDGRINKAPKTCCKDYKRYEDIHTHPYKYCQMYLIEPGSVSNPLKDINDNINTRVRILFKQLYPVNNGQPREVQKLAFLQSWPLFRDWFADFLKVGFDSQDDLYSLVAFIPWWPLFWDGLYSLVAVIPRWPVFPGAL